VQVYAPQRIQRAQAMAVADRCRRCGTVTPRMMPRALANVRAYGVAGADPRGMKYRFSLSTQMYLPTMT
jgi:hypothetical protein